MRSTSLGRSNETGRISSCRSTAIPDLRSKSRLIQRRSDSSIEYLQFITSAMRPDLRKSATRSALQNLCGHIGFMQDQCSQLIKSCSFFMLIVGFVRARAGSQPNPAMEGQNCLSRGGLFSLDSWPAQATGQGQSDLQGDATRISQIFNLRSAIGCN